MIESRKLDLLGNQAGKAYTFANVVVIPLKIDCICTNNPSVIAVKPYRQSLAGIGESYETN